MRIAFCYPPISQGERFPTLPQNRQFIYTASRQVKIFPVVMATAATWLSNLGHQVLWLDGVTRRMAWQDYERKLEDFDPELVVLEGKAPVMPKLWRYIDDLKSMISDLKIVLVGDHVSFFPAETLKKSKADYVITGGDYDFLLVNLVKHLTTGDKLRGGVWHKEINHKSEIIIHNSGKATLDDDLNQTPIINRQLTRWADYGEAYLFHPAAYIMSGRGCGIDARRTGVCNFCIWQYALWGCRARLASPKHVLAEVKNLVNLGVKEIFDDNESGACWNEEWLEEFYQLMKKEKLLGKVIFSSNARGDQLTPTLCKLLKKIGLRLLKVGLESGSNETLKKIGKRETIEQISKGVKNAKDAGLRVMLTVMTGYPWEKEEDVKKTYQVTCKLMFYKTRAGDCLQASVIIPYPGTPLWHQAKRNGWLLVDPYGYEKFDMSQPVLRTEIDTQSWCNKIWSIQSDPQFILRSGLTIKSASEMALLLRGAKSLLGHIKDYVKIVK